MKIRRKISGALSILILAIIIFSSIFATYVAPYDPNVQDSSRRLEEIGRASCRERV